jgi:cytochrome c556
MRSRSTPGATVIVVALALAAAAHAAPAHVAGALPGQGPGWTGITRPKDVITARQELMEHAELLMEPIDTIQVEPIRDVKQLHANAEAISAMLLALPHLFPPTTNLFDPKAQMPETLALPAIWKSFGSFYALATAASTAAQAMADAEGPSALRAASRGLRASCDACHSVYLRPYSPPKVLESDYEFDFDSILGKK